MVGQLVNNATNKATSTCSYERYICICRCVSTIWLRVYGTNPSYSFPLCSQLANGPDRLAIFIWWQEGAQGEEPKLKRKGQGWKMHWKYPGRDPSSTNDIFLNGPTHLEEVCVPECGGEAEDVVPLGVLRDGLRRERERQL